MRKKLILFLMLALFGSANFLRADEVTIGDPTSTVTSSYLPGYSLYDYAISQQIYTADEIGMGGTINSLTMWLKNTSSYARNYNIYMKEVSETAFADATSWVSMTASDMVGSYVLNNNITDPVESTITLTTPFAYTGTGSLVICVQDATGQWSSGAVGVTMAATGNQAIYAYRDGTIFDPTTPGVNGTLAAIKNVVRLDITAGGGGSVEITIGDGTSTTYYTPFNSLYGYSFTEQVYLASEIGTAGNITSISFYLGTANTSADQTNEYSLYMKNVTRETFASNTDYETVTASDVVFEGTWTIPMNYTGWLTINLDTPFAYDGTSNLMIGLHEKTSGYSTRYFTYTTVNNSGFQLYSDSYNPDPYNIGSYSGTKTTRNQRSNIMLNITTGGGGAGLGPWDPNYDEELGEIVIVAPESGAQNVTPTVLRWTNAENAHYYSVEFGTVYGNLETLISDEPIEDWDGSLTLADYDIVLDNNTRYFWRVINENNVGETSELSAFVTPMTKPNNVKVLPPEIFVDESTIVKWSIVGGAIGELPETQIGEGTSTSGYFPTYNLYNYSLTEQIFTVEEIGNAGIINSITFMPQGSITRNLEVYMINTDKTSFTGSSDFVAVTADDKVFEGSVAMASPQTTITLNDPFMFDGTNLLLVVNDLTGTWTSSVSYLTFTATAQGINVYQDAAAYNPLAPSYSGTVRDFKNQIIINKDRRVENRDLLGCNVYVDSVLMNTDGPITERQYELTPAHMESLGVPAYNIEGHDVNVTGVYDYGESSYSATATLKISGYGAATGFVKELMSAEPVEGVTVTYAGRDEFNNVVNYTATTNASGIYNIAELKAGTYKVTASADGMGNAVVEDVVVAYNQTTTCNLYIHEEYLPVYKVFAMESDAQVTGELTAEVIWSFNNFANPSTGGSGAGDEFTEGFESGMPEGWNIIDANNDGYTWCMTSNIPNTWTYYASLTLDWYRTGTNAICSGSYINGVGALTPDEYLVTPLVNIGAGSTFSFWAAATDASYPADHFGVFVSDNGTSDWTMVNEWTLTGKSRDIDGGAASREGKGAKLGTWHNFSVDLSSYAGQKYIAIRHFNCNDQYIMCVDDIELGTGSKRANDPTAETCGVNLNNASSREMWDLLLSFEATSAYQYGVATDGNYIYTSSWSASSTSQFYKYDMNGNFVEEFNVSGSGQIRDLTYDGQYFYGVANSSTIYCLDLANHTLVSTITSAYGTMRCCGYDSNRDGFWVVGNWSGNLSLVDRSGAVQITGPTPTSASGVAYYRDGNNVEHVYCFNNGDNGIYDYDIAANTIGSAALFTPAGTGSAGGCHIANYGDKLAFYSDMQQDPQLIGIYELGAAQGAGGTGGWQQAETNHYFNLYRETVLAENMPEEPIELVAEQIAWTDTVYSDYNWNSQNAGIYRYGVQAVYPWMQRNDNNFTAVTWSNNLARDMKGQLTVNVINTTGETVEGATVALTNNDQNIHYNAELDETGVMVVEDFTKGNYNLMVELDGYYAVYEGNAIPEDGVDINMWVDTLSINVELMEIFTPVSGITVSSTGFARWTNMIPETRYAQRYHVLCDDIFQGETTNNWMFLNTENLVPGETYTAAVAVIYTTGMSDFVTTTFTYEECDFVDPQVDSLDAEVDLADVILTWSAGGGTTPTPPPGNASTFTEGFEGGMPAGWTVIDDNNDGWTWCMTSDIPSTWTYYASLTLDWYRTGTNAICSGSYINGVGALNPDEYLVTDLVNLSTGSTFSFWAAATDASYPADHFGVFVSDNGTSDWTMVNEWTLTAKEGGMDGGLISRDGNGAKLGTWHNFTVDLSSYAGEKYIAIRHFNCTDQYIMCVDDIELTAGAKTTPNLDIASLSEEEYQMIFGYAPKTANTVEPMPAIEGLRGNTAYACNAYGGSNPEGWISYDLDAPANGTSINSGLTVFGGDRAADGFVYATYNDNTWKKIEPETGTVVAQGSLGMFFVDCAYDYTTNTMYGSYSGGLYVWDLETNTTSMVGTMGSVQSMQMIACDLNGQLYGVAYSTGDFYAIDKNTGAVTLIGNTGQAPAYVQGGGFDHNTGILYWTGYSSQGFIAEINVSTGALTMLAQNVGEQLSFNVPFSGGVGGGSVPFVAGQFNILMDGEWIGSTPDNTFTWICEDAVEHEYCVMYVDEDYNFSCAACILVTADPLGVGQYDIVNAIYPNPTSGDLHITTSADMVSISIVNMLGQVVYNKATEGTETVINMAQFGNGVYMVSIVTENGTSVERIIVNK